MVSIVIVLRDYKISILIRICNRDFGHMGMCVIGDTIALAALNHIVDVRFTHVALIIDDFVKGI